MNQLEGNYQLGIIVAMEVELKEIRLAMENPQHQRFGTMDFYTGAIEGIPVVAARSGVGKVCGAVCAQTMILEYRPSYILCAGIAGSLKTLTMGEVALGERLLQHDFDITAWDYPLAFIPAVRTAAMESHGPMLLALKEAAVKLGFGYALGSILSGDAFIALPEKKKQLQDSFPDAIACEMEGAAIAQVCAMNQVPFCVIRAISDHSEGIEEENRLTMEELASQVSAQMVLTFIKGDFFHDEVHKEV